MAATTHQIGSNGGGSMTVQEISVAYDQPNDGVTVTPEQVPKGTPVRFKDPSGGKLKIVFLSPTGKGTEAILDTDVCTLTVGGCYHFDCYFTSADGTSVINPKNGGLLDVVPQRP